MRWSSLVAIAGAAARPARRRPARSGCPAPSSTRDAAGREPGGDGGQPVALLDPQLGQPAHHRRAVGEGGGHRQDRIFVDHRRRARRRHRHAGQPPSRARGGRPTGSPPSSRAFVMAMSAPISRSVSNRPVRSGLSPTLESVTSEPGTQQRRDQRKGGRGGVARHARCAAPVSSGWPAMRDAAAVARSSPPRTVGAEMAQHALGMVARRLGLDHRGCARRVAARPAAPPTSPAPRPPAGGS